MNYALTLKQPWATAVMLFGKSIENRNWPPYASIEFPFDLWVHAGSAWDSDWHSPLLGLATEGRLPVSAAGLLLGSSTQPETQREAGFPRGAILGQVTVVGAHEAGEACGEACGTWGNTAAGMWHWELTDPQIHRELVPAAGLQKLWTPKGQVADKLAERIRPNDP